MGMWIELLTTYAAALITIATVILGTRFAVRPREGERAESSPVLVIPDQTERRRNAA
ncbi:MAG TPA: hypothetical protein VLA09_07655 [Longimicrobiales bacterium]|nr:hypothetical protein [Longimicrobiales bacterium]